MTSTGQRAPTSSAANRRRPATLLLGSLFLGSLALRLWGINFGLPALYRPDEDVTVGRAMGILQGVFDPHFADWPHLYFYVSAAWLAPFHWVGLVSDQASGYLGVRVLDAIIGSLTVLVLFEFGRRAYGWLAGVFAALALSVAYLHVRDSHFATTDIPLTLAILLGLYIAYRTVSARGVRPLLLNGVILGIAASLKYNGALLASGMAAAQYIGGRLVERPVVRLIGRLAVIALIGVVTLAITSPFLVLDPALTAHGVGYIFFHLSKSTAPNIGWVELSLGLWYGIDPSLVAVALLGIGYAAWKRQTADWIILTFLVVYFIFIGVGGSVFFRYADPMIPPLLLLGGRAIADLVKAASSARVRWLTLGTATAVILLPSLIHDVQYDLLIQQTDTRTLAFNWMAAHMPAGGRAAVPYMAGPAHDQHLVDSAEHSHGATDPYVASFLDSRLETQYTIMELTQNDLETTATMDRFRQQGIHLVVVGEQYPQLGCRVDTPLERALQRQATLVASFSPTIGCPDSAFDPIDTYYVPLAGYGGWVRPGPPIRIYQLPG